jgi:hypothetical protein
MTNERKRHYKRLLLVFVVGLVFVSVHGIYWRAHHPPAPPPPPTIIVGRVISCWDPSEGRENAEIDVLRLDGTIWHYVDRASLPRCASFTAAPVWQFSLRPGHYDRDEVYEVRQVR